MSLEKNRRKIDQIDGKIVKLLNERALESLKIGKTKQKLNKPTFAPSREKEVYKKVLDKNKGPLSEESMKAVYREIMSGSRALNSRLCIAYLGPETTFTHIAALGRFGGSSDYSKCETITDVFTEVERGRANYGVVPIENSTEGAVNHTLDMFINSELKIYSEIYLPIEHNLLSKHKEISSIKRVYSHEQVFAQCRMWLEKKLPNAKLMAYPSTATAAFYCSARKGGAAIASKLAAKKYGLKTLARSIQDSAHNTTRFLIIAREEAEQSRNDKTSIVFSLKDKVGVLHDALVPFKKNRINLTKIESRPSQLKAWEYYFYVDLEGHYKDKEVRKAITELEKNCTYFKILGSYPVGK
ncbi:MAG: prephenate dehydratase [Candidatus Omnitrophica bacterium]|nr:prephenate dehydratase [Candidatus Omnitrophota bacterium]